MCADARARLTRSRRRRSLAADRLAATLRPDEPRGSLDMTRKHRARPESSPGSTRSTTSLNPDCRGSARPRPTSWPGLPSALDLVACTSLRPPTPSRRRSGALSPLGPASRRDQPGLRRDARARRQHDRGGLRRDVLARGEHAGAARRRARPRRGARAGAHRGGQIAVGRVVFEAWQRRSIRSRSKPDATLDRRSSSASGRCAPSKPESPFAVLANHQDKRLTATVPVLASAGTSAGTPTAAENLVVSRPQPAMVGRFRGAAVSARSGQPRGPVANR